MKKAKVRANDEIRLRSHAVNVLFLIAITIAIVRSGLRPIHRLPFSRRTSHDIRFVVAANNFHGEIFSTRDSLCSKKKRPFCRYNLYLKESFKRHAMQSDCIKHTLSFLIYPTRYKS